ncbi:MAG TPA: serine/threonine-protein kinase [Candidatus Aquilonibacter sp.]|nr:serine/threonine-protein kinase [Candidatus Aquilonibacter sp.]
MNQPTDPRGSNGAERSASATDSSRGSRSQQDTVLLSDVPDAESLIASSRETSSGETSGAMRATPANATTLNLSTAALSALGQRYDILDEAGHGSMGNVYKARDRETGETVALKLLKPEIASDQQMMDRFKNELLFARKITHKNICRVHEFNRLGSVAYTSMEFVEGESLRSVLNRFGALSLRKGIDLAQQMCSGLKEAHAQGIVHRDLKPENVMIDTRGNVKIMDFGIARSMESMTRLTGAMVGTPAYMAPEQVAGKPVDYRTDIYSLGLILYEVFTGAPAFTAENAVAVAMKQLRESPVPPHEIDPGMPVPIERAILKALEKEPEKRFQSIAEMEKVFVPPAASGAVFVGGSTTAGHSTQEALAMQTVATPAARQAHLAAQAKPKSSRAKWIVPLVLVAFFVLLAAAAGQWAKNAKIAQKLAAPPAPAAPALPDFALNEPTERSAAPAAASAVAADSASSAALAADQPGAAATAPAASSSQGQAATTQPAGTQTTAASGAAALPPVAAKGTAGANATSAPAPPGGASSGAGPNIQQRMEAAFGQGAPANSNQAAGPAANTQPPMGSVLPGKGPSYIFVGHYEREDRAQDASRKIQGLGLTSIVIPRRGEDGQRGFAVITGPFPPERIPSVIDWLRTQGFNEVREVKGFGAGFRGGRGRSADPQATPDGNSE